MKIAPADVPSVLQLVSERLSALPGTLAVRIEIRVSSKGSHQVATLDELRSVWSIIELGTADASTGRHRTQWVRGEIGPVEVVAHYAPGLLGKVRKQRVVERDVETHIDLSRLKSQP